MKLFRLFGDNNLPKLTEEQTSESNSIEQEQNEETQKVEKESPKPDNLITITWGTGMPIDVIFNYIHKDFEEEGFQDALVNSDLKYRETRESILRNDLKMLFRRITLRYQSDIRVLEVQIRNAQEASALSSASMLQAQLETYQEHLKEIDDMEQLLDNNDPKMITMIESYRRGFLKGITAKTAEFIQK